MAEPSPPPIQIPLLIQEKLNFYIWQNKVKMVNNEYFSLFIIMNGSQIGWSYLKGLNRIVTIESPVRGTKIKNWTRNKSNDSKLILVPTKYNYTSGLDFLTGYKMSFFQEYIIKYPEFVTAVTTDSRSYIDE
jgi:hypothetical protein